MISRVRPLCLVLLVAGLGCQAGREPDERDWLRFSTKPDNARRIEALERVLRKHRVHEVVPLRRLLFQGRQFELYGAPPFALPPRRRYASITPLLRFIKDQLVPVTGPVRVASGFRTPRYNREAGGARRSRHLRFQALDLEPHAASSRSELHQRLLRLWRRRGQRHKLGLGLYGGTRFHLDVGRYRRWGP